MAFYQAKINKVKLVKFKPKNSEIMKLRAKMIKIFICHFPKLIFVQILQKRSFSCNFTQYSGNIINKFYNFYLLFTILPEY